MLSTHPPRLARWLLNHFGCSPNNEALIGDLDEQYRKRHSRRWYWRCWSLSSLVFGMRFVTHNGSIFRRSSPPGSFFGLSLLHYFQCSDVALSWCALPVLEAD